jgi:hypothetical protein
MIVSAYDSLEDINISKKAGANIHVSKPINKKILSEQLPNFNKRIKK